MPFRVTNISNELLNSKPEYNKPIVIDDIIIRPGESQFYHWSSTPVHINILKLKNIIHVESVTDNDYNTIIIHENKSEEIRQEELKKELKPKKEKKIVVEETIEELDNEEIISVDEDKPKATKKKKSTE